MKPLVSIHGMFPGRKFLMPAALFFSAVLLSCENDAEKVKQWTEKAILTEEILGVDSYMSQNGKMRARLRTPLMIRVPVDSIYIEFPKSLQVEFFDSSNQVETWLSSNYGRHYENLNKVYLRDSVLVITRNGDTLKSADLWWDQNTKMFYTDQYALYTGPGKVIHGGRGMTATQDLSSVVFNQPTGTVEVSESGFPK